VDGELLPEDAGGSEAGPRNGRVVEMLRSTPWWNDGRVPCFTGRHGFFHNL